MASDQHQMDQPLSECLSEGELRGFDPSVPAKDTACIGDLLVVQEWLPSQQPGMRHGNVKNPSG